MYEGISNLKFKKISPDCNLFLNYAARGRSNLSLRFLKISECTFNNRSLFQDLRYGICFALLCA